MTDNVVPLNATTAATTTAAPAAPPASTPIFVCHCGCSTFELWADGAAVCALCHVDVSADTGAWYEDTPPEAPQRDPALSAPVRTLQGNGDIDFARRVIAKRAQEPDTTAIVIVRKSGAIHTWSAAETPEQALWVLHRVKDALKLLRWQK